MEKWPNFFIVGAPRAGTTSLYEFLKNTPSIYMSKEKEPCHFCNIRPKNKKNNPFSKKEKYLDLFTKVKNETAIGEASTVYLWDPESPKLIHQVVPKAKIIIMLRDPISRAFSHYLMRIGGGEMRPFSKVVQAALIAPDEDYYTHVITNGSFYSEQVKRYQNIFGKDNVKIIIFEEFIANTKKILKEVLEFLEINEELPEIDNLIHNVFTIPRGNMLKYLLQSDTVKKIGYRLPKYYSEPIVKKALSKKSVKPKILPEDVLLLKDVFKEDVEDLKTLLNRSLPWKNFKNSQH